MASYSIFNEEDDITQGCSQLDTSSSLSGLDDQTAAEANDLNSDSFAFAVNPSEDGRKTRRGHPRRRMPTVQTVDGDILIRKRSCPPSSKLYLSLGADHRDPSSSTDFFTSQSKISLNKRKRDGFYSSKTCAALLDLSVASQRLDYGVQQPTPTNEEAVDQLSSDEDLRIKIIRDGHPPKRQKFDSSSRDDATDSQSSRTSNDGFINDSSRRRTKGPMSRGNAVSTNHQHST